MSSSSTNTYKVRFDNSYGSMTVRCFVINMQNGFITDTATATVYF